jgi:multisubunit Na+/H+ antiporter MnhB subunit
MSEAAVIYLTITLIAIILIIIALIVKHNKKKELSKLTLFAIVLVTIGGAVDSRLAGYLFIGAGVVITALDFFQNRNKK